MKTMDWILLAGAAYLGYEWLTSSNQSSGSGSSLGSALQTGVGDVLNPFGIVSGTASNLSHLVASAIPVSTSQGSTAGPATNAAQSAVSISSLTRSAVQAVAPTVSAIGGVAINSGGGSSSFISNSFLPTISIGNAATLPLVGNPSNPIIGSYTPALQGPLAPSSVADMQCFAILGKTV